LRRRDRAHDLDHRPLVACRRRRRGRARRAALRDRNRRDHRLCRDAAGTPLGRAALGSRDECHAEVVTSMATATQPAVSTIEPMPRSNVVELSGLVKSFRTPKGPVPAVRGVDLSVRAGEIVALLGPNGAGKSTTIDMLLGLTEPDAGTARLLG